MLELWVPDGPDAAQARSEPVVRVLYNGEAVAVKGCAGGGANEGCSFSQWQVSACVRRVPGGSGVARASCTRRVVRPSSRCRSCIQRRREYAHALESSTASPA